MFMQVKNDRICKRTLNTVCEDHFACLHMPQIAKAVIKFAAERSFLQLRSQHGTARAVR
ncbi:hypothetical protein BAAA27672_02525 [Bifidobacterium animalis subsp. animalis ATCC 27672]|nr:hypothetical protein BAAA27672_02525 [Bifidobacterium animalis subsp. animalis ATCC 27672]